MNTEIIYFHIGDQDYVVDGLRQIKKYNPKKNIHFIGKTNNKNILNLVTYYNIDSLLCEKSIRFINNFKNYSTNSHELEKLCILRWFCIKNLWKNEKFDKIFYTDCDIMHYSNIEKESNKFSNFLFSIAAKTSGHTSFFNNINVLEDYCNLISNFYSQTKTENLPLSIEKNININFYFQQQITNYELRLKNNLLGGICDMTFWMKLKDVYFAGLVGEVCDIIEGSAFDHTIRECDGYEMSNGIKNIKFINNEPYCFNNIIQKNIKLNSIHFQGGEFKDLMKKYAN